MIPGINQDKISDITANILKNQLIVYTQEQCDKLGIPMSRVPVSNVFDLETFNFRSFYTELPVINTRPKILLPLPSVRIVPELSKDKYYRNYVLEFLKAEHQHAGDSLSSVLRNGKVVVKIMDLKKEYPLGTDFLHEFSKEHPEILKRYKSALRKSAAARATAPPLATKRRILSASERIAILEGIEPGNEGATNFHKISFDSLIRVFAVRLSNPVREKEINEGRKRIDIVFDNSDKAGFFDELNRLYRIPCPKIFAECKNYGREIGNPEIDQLAMRFSSRRGMFGILVCRSIKDRESLIKRCRDVLKDRDGFIIVLDDTDLGCLLQCRDNGDESGIDNFMRTRLDELIM